MWGLALLSQVLQGALCIERDGRCWLAAQVPLVARPAARRQQLSQAVVASAAAVEASTPTAVAHLRYSRGSPLKVRGLEAWSSGWEGWSVGAGTRREGELAGRLMMSWLCGFDTCSNSGRGKNILHSDFGSLDSK